jgi:exopolyphosphatase/guanosine-5'-triphosphate,3'-diphosphate pyrophosphatase
LRRAAALDLGSNTLRLLLADVGPDSWRPVGRGLATPRLGRGLAAGGLLDPAAKAEARRVAESFTRQARELGAERVALAATQACRQARDGAAFVAELARDLGLDRARVVSGEEEATLSRLGTLSRLKGPLKGALLADVGGGSTELVDLGHPAAPSLSLALGAVSLSEAHLRSDPPLPEQMQALARAVHNGLEPLSGRRATRLVASAGTAATLASLVLRLNDYQPELVDNLVVDRQQLLGQMARLAALPLSQRRLTPGLEPERADIILGGLAILDGLLERLGLERLTLMDAGLLEGILLDDLANDI